MKGCALSCVIKRQKSQFLLIRSMTYDLRESMWYQPGLCWQLVRVGPPQSPRWWSLPLAPDRDTRRTRSQAAASRGASQSCPWCWWRRLSGGDKRLGVAGGLRESLPEPLLSYRDPQSPSLPTGGMVGRTSCCWRHLEWRGPRWKPKLSDLSPHIILKLSDEKNLTKRIMWLPKS